MTDISNKTLVYLFVIAVAITLVGTTASMMKLGKVELPLMTGFAARVSNGTVNISISGLVAISLAANYGLVDFGNGSLTGSPYTNINTILATNPSTFNEPTEFRVQNDGNIDVNITVNGSGPNTLFGTTNIDNYAWNGSSGSGGCNEDSGTNLTAAVANFSATPALACANLTFRSPGDNFGVEIYLSIRNDQPAGLKQDTAVGFNAVACGTVCG